MPEITNSILCGDSLSILKTMPSNSVHCVVTSPPYYGLRSYLSKDDKYKKYEIGNEESIEEYIKNIAIIFNEINRVLRTDGTCWINIGDSYATTPAGNKKWNKNFVGNRFYEENHIHQVKRKKYGVGIKIKDLIGIPWRIAFELQLNGWWLRSDIIWHKPNPKPESILDRPTKSHEYIFLLAKSARYYYDSYAISEQAKSAGKSVSLGEKSLSRGTATAMSVNPSGNATKDFIIVPEMRNARTVWSITTQKHKESHFAVFPDELVKRCISAGTSEYGCCSVCGVQWKRSKSNINEWVKQCNCNSEVVPSVVLDPFAGSGTTLKVANSLNRSSIGIELNSEYIDIIKNKLNVDQVSLF